MQPPTFFFFCCCCSFCLTRSFYIMNISQYFCAAYKMQPFFFLSLIVQDKRGAKIIHTEIKVALIIEKKKNEIKKNLLSIETEIAYSTSADTDLQTNFFFFLDDSAQYIYTKKRICRECII